MKIGHAISMEYPVGKYFIKEVSVNEYYLLDGNNSQEIEITEDKQIVTVIFKNKSVPYEEEPVIEKPILKKLPKTGW